MKFGDYYRATVFLPLLAGVVCMSLTFTGAVSDPFVSFTALATRFGGIPYLIYALAMYAWSLRRSDAEIRAAYWRLPLVWLPFLVLLPVALAIVAGDWSGLYGVTLYVFVLAQMYVYGFALLIYGGWSLVSWTAEKSAGTVA